MFCLSLICQFKTPFYKNYVIRQKCKTFDKMSLILENTNRKISTCDLRFFYFENNNKKEMKCPWPKCNLSYLH